jgi:exodeoxyribonuclease-5
MIPLLPSRAMRPTPAQQEAIDRIVYNTFHGDRVSVLCGYAGTGKTFTTARLIDRLVAEGLNIAMAAPTHKAARQLARAMRSLGVDLEPVTLHSLLGLKPYRCQETGDQKFMPDGKENRLALGRQKYDQELRKYVDVPDIDIVIVDETSMISNELYRLLMSDLNGRPVVFVGDDRQLFPVKEAAACPALYETISIYRLTEVMRHDGAILNLATQTRSLDIGRARFQSSDSGGSRVVAYKYREEWLQSMLDHAERSAESDDPDIFRVLCWQNRNVENMNKRIHCRRYGIDAPDFLPKMQCVTVEPYVDSATGSVILPGTADVLIVTAKIKMLRPITFFVDKLGMPTRESLPIELKDILDAEPAYSCWDLELSGIDYGDIDMVIQADVLHQRSLKDWNETQNKIANCAKAYGRRGDNKTRAKIWDFLYWRKGQLAYIQPSTALTIHKSQGSTFDTVFLHPDIDGGHSRQTALQNQLAYVGITRASRELHVVADRWR